MKTIEVKVDLAPQDPYECTHCGHHKSLHHFPHGKDNAYICLSVFPTFCDCKEFEDE